MDEAWHDNLVILTTRGELDEAAAATVCDRLEGWAADPRRAADAVVIDLLAVHGGSGAAVERLRRVVEQVGTRFAVCVVIDDASADRLRLRGADSQVAVEPSIEAAMGALLSRSAVGELQEQLANRDRQLDSMPAIEQVKGMLRQDFGLDDTRAVDLLKRLSQDTNVKLRDLAERLVGELSGTASSDTSAVTLKVIHGLRDQLRARPDGGDVAGPQR